MDEKFPKKTSTDESKGEMLMDDCNHMNEATNMGWGVYVLKSSKIPSEIVVHCHCKLGKRCKKLNSLMVNI
mgnify:CR=1 FL=1